LLVVFIALFFSTAVIDVLWASQTVAVEARIPVEAILVVAFFIVDRGAVVRAAVQTSPVFTADVAKRIAALASTIFFLAHILRGRP
jgi:hypothetical protein